MGVDVLAPNQKVKTEAMSSFEEDVVAALVVVALVVVAVEVVEVVVVAEVEENES
jgi:hypothetical protein